VLSPSGRRILRHTLRHESAGPKCTRNRGHRRTDQRERVGGDGSLMPLSYHLKLGLIASLGARGSGKSTLAEALRFAVCGASAVASTDPAGQGGGVRLRSSFCGLLPRVTGCGRRNWPRGATGATRVELGTERFQRQWFGSHVRHSCSPVSSNPGSYISRLHLGCNNHQPKSPWGEFGKVPGIGRFRTGFDFLIR
jgi:hypothetical protein